MPTSPVIRLTLTPEIQNIMNYLKAIYPLLNESEILKLALGGYYQYLKPASVSKNNLTADNKYQEIKIKIKKRLQGKYSNTVFSQQEIDSNSF